MKRFLILLFVIIATPLKTWAQIGEHSQLHNMIRTGIVKYIEWIDDLGGYTGKEFYVCTKGVPADFFTDSCCVIKNVTYISLDNPDGAPRQFKKMFKKGFKALFVQFKLYKDQILVDISGRWVQWYKRHFIIGEHDWGDYFYEYSQDEKDWILKEIKYGGI